MGNPILNLDTTKLRDLLSEEHYKMALNNHIEYREECMTVRLKNTLDMNTLEWMTALYHRPKSDLEGLYQSNMANDVMSLLSQEVSKIKEKSVQ